MCKPNEPVEITEILTADDLKVVGPIVLLTAIVSLALSVGAIPDVGWGRAVSLTVAVSVVVFVGVSLVFAYVRLRRLGFRRVRSLTRSLRMTLRWLFDLP